MIWICKNRRKDSPHVRTFPPSSAQTALGYETAVSDGGRLELKTPREREKSVLFAAQEPPDDMSDSD